MKLFWILLGSFQQSLSSADETLISNVVEVEDTVIGTILGHIRLIGTGIALIAMTVMSIAYFTADRKIFSSCYREKGSYSISTII